MEKRGTPGVSADGQTSPSVIFGEEQVQQWRAQSMHQLQELEIMNQALRSTLNLQTPAPPTGMSYNVSDSNLWSYAAYNRHFFWIKKHSNRQTAHCIDRICNQYCSGSAGCRTDDHFQAAWYNTSPCETNFITVLTVVGKEQFSVSLGFFRRVLPWLNYYSCQISTRRSYTYGYTIFWWQE